MARVGRRNWGSCSGNDRARNPNVRAIIVVEGTPTPTKDLKCGRVWVWIDPNGVVTRAPSVNSNPTAAPMKQPNSDFSAIDRYFLAKDRALVPPAGPNPCIPRVGVKRSWPELVGEIWEAAAVKIERENPNVRAIIVVEGTPTPTKDLKCARVWVWIDPNGVVTRAPSVRY
ncbi:hypothetical protein Pyn_26181 [Prunus yedoensis var. nudiflora]|uniref:Uncharacterized protein n=1 Tax=Prunus yedoensis var. nudiflora TaxID=2094558 RepID=A0A314ZFZ4_PRUYE|nr:hypothetical protein Pyn_26181 [Prunus yedoensis var. nudiflora]